MTHTTPPPSSHSATPDSATRTALGRRIAGIAALFACALVVDPARVVPEVTALHQINTATALHSLVIPALAALGLWLVLPNITVLALCVLLLAGAHAQPGANDLFSGYLYPLLALLAAAVLIKTLLPGKNADPDNALNNQ